MSTDKKVFQTLPVKEKSQYPQHDCKNRHECMRAIQMILDNEATYEQLEHFKQNIDKCLPCIENYNLEVTIRQILCDKIERKTVPTDVIDAIKVKINAPVA
jgi:anti-sigma factor (TIGR02949 family)